MGYLPCDQRSRTPLETPESTTTTQSENNGTGGWSSPPIRGGGLSTLHEPPGAVAAAAPRDREHRGAACSYPHRDRPRWPRTLSLPLSRSLQANSLGDAGPKHPPNRAASTTTHAQSTTCPLLRSKNETGGETARPRAAR